MKAWLFKCIFVRASKCQGEIRWDFFMVSVSKLNSPASCVCSLMLMHNNLLRSQTGCLFRADITRLQKSSWGPEGHSVPRFKEGANLWYRALQSRCLELRLAPFWVDCAASGSVWVWSIWEDRAAAWRTKRCSKPTLNTHADQRRE